MRAAYKVLMENKCPCFHVNAYMFSIKNTMRSAVDGASKLRFLEMMSCCVMCSLDQYTHVTRYVSL